MTMSTTCPRCKGELTIDRQWIGRSVDCPYCNTTFTFEGTADMSSLRARQPQKKAVKEYKVLTQKDKWFSGKFDPEKLEGAINAYAKQGWRVVGCATASMPSLLSYNREELIVIMERG